ncbi:hypothetical protein J2X46_000256 [Nocardioides sp. BE266]|uniref:hypothetical protein n=1 Tax=Nocardioides sp. BE266 TaxID=2817725 RepID=UPI002855A3B0|nr:hypothetical protein [Nocardioides sp. BE266]MDR7251284.1 hypothetical protein [Nocardioides sp. BE266]
MALERLTRIATLSLGALYVAAGIGKVAEASSSEGGLALGTLVTAGALVLIGLALTTRQPHVGRGLVCVGSLMGIIATAWTIVVPVLALGVVFLTLRETVSA